MVRVKNARMFSVSTHVIQTENAKACLLQLGDLSHGRQGPKKPRERHPHICMYYVDTWVLREIIYFK